MPYAVAAAAAGTNQPAATAAKIKTASHTEFLTRPFQCHAVLSSSFAPVLHAPFMPVLGRSGTLVPFTAVLGRFSRQYVEIS